MAAAVAASTAFSPVQPWNATNSHLTVVQTCSSSEFRSRRSNAAAAGASASVVHKRRIPSPESSGNFIVPASSDLLLFLKHTRRKGTIVCQNNISVTARVLAPAATALAVSSSSSSSFFSSSAAVGCRTTAKRGLTRRGRGLGLGLQRSLRTEEEGSTRHHHYPLATSPSALPSPSTEEADLIMGIGMASSNEREWESRRTASTDLLVVGPGVLGSLVAQLWLKDNEGSLVVGQTNTTVHHENLKALGIVPISKDSRNDVKFPNVIFCAPPSGSSDYPAEIRAAAQKWNGEGTLLFTSSSGVYDVTDNGPCFEETAPVVSKGKSPRTDRLLDAEAEVLKVGGNVVRLAGLYSFNRGAHMFYLSKGSVESRPDHVLNLIHYEDAASLCVAILKGGSREKIYMGCDNVPISRQEMMDAVNASGKFEQKFSEFTGVDGALGKKMNNDVTRGITHWTPKYESFPSFLGITGNTFSKH